MPVPQRHRDPVLPRALDDSKPSGVHRAGPAPRRMARHQRAASVGSVPWLTVLGVAALAAIVGWWTWRALHDPHGYDFRLAYRGGHVAWATGHPEQQSTWTGTPLLAAGLAVVTRLMS